MFVHISNAPQSRVSVVATASVQCCVSQSGLFGGLSRYYECGRSNKAVQLICLSVCLLACLSACVYYETSPESSRVLHCRALGPWTTTLHSTSCMKKVKRNRTNKQMTGKVPVLVRYVFCTALSKTEKNPCQQQQQQQRREQHDNAAPHCFYYNMNLVFTDLFTHTHTHTSTYKTTDINRQHNRQ